MSLIQIQNLAFCHEGSWQPVFERLNLQLDTSWRLGVVGRNGRGKTTLFGLLCGRWPYEGHITAPTLFEYFPFPIRDAGQLALDAAREACPTLAQWQLERELGRMGADPALLWQPYDTLSQGQQTKLLLAALFLKEGCFPLIDEPTNHLDAAGRRQLARYLAGKQGFMLVSHDRDFLDACTDHILAINRADVQLIQGNYSTWQNEKLRQDAFEAERNEKLKKEAARLQEAARRAAGFAQRAEKEKKGQGQNSSCGLRPDRGFLGAKAARLMKSAKNIEARRTAAAEEKARLLKNVDAAETLGLRPLAWRGGPLVQLEGVSVAYPQRTVFERLNLRLCGGERLALLGANGCGKSSLLKLILGQAVPHTGLVRTAAGAVISYLPQGTGHLAGSLAAFAEEEKIDYTLLLTLLRKLGFERAQFERDMAQYSGGQKKKVLLAASLCRSAHLYLWDEPLNFIDLDSRLQIEQLILQANPTLLFVEHDAAFVRRVATRIVDFSAPGR